jgi:single-strand DNA-binding protein
MNIAILLGNLTQDPELKHTNGGTPVCEFTLAHNEKWRTESGEQKERVSFIGCVMWGKRAEAFARWHKKGSKVLIHGKLVTDMWEEKETGKKRSKTKLQAEAWEFVGNRQDDLAAAPRSATAAPKPATKPDTEDDVPF